MTRASDILGELLASFQTREGGLRADFDPGSMAMAIRAAIDVAPSRLADPEFDIDKYTHEIVTLFQLATRAHAIPARTG